MVALTSAELTYMRECTEDLMPDTCNILTVTQTSDGQGGWTETWGTATTGQKCRFDNVMASERLGGGAVQPFHSYWVSLPYNTAITTEQRIEKGSDTFAVTSVDDDKSWNAVTRVWAELI